MELSRLLFPEQQIENIQETLKTNDLLANNFSIDNHPKINALETKIDMLK
jgi:hypothetical protein